MTTPCSAWTPWARQTGCAGGSSRSRATWPTASSRGSGTALGVSRHVTQEMTGSLSSGPAAAGAHGGNTGSAERVLCRAGRPCRRSSPAREVDERAGGVRSLVGQQPEDGGRDLLRLAAPLHRHQRLDPVHAVRFAAAGVDISVDEAGPDRVDAGSGRVDGDNAVVEFVDTAEVLASRGRRPCRPLEGPAGMPYLCLRWRPV